MPRTATAAPDAAAAADTTDPIPSTAANAPVPARLVLPALASKTIVIRDPDTGRWVTKEVAGDEGESLEAVYDPNDIQDVDPCNIDNEWNESGRGVMMEYRWLQVDSRWSSRERGLGYEPVDPKSFVTRRFTVVELPGVGKCYKYNDVYLCEIPKSIAEARRKKNEELFQRENLQRMYGLQDEDKEISAQHGGLVTMIRKERDGSPMSELSYDRRNPIQDEVDSYERALEKMESYRTGSAR